MFFRYFVVLCVIALFAAAINAEEDTADVEERVNPLVGILIKTLGSLFAGAAAGCLTEAAEKCKDHWNDLGAALSCGKDFLAENKGKCAIG